MRTGQKMTASHITTAEQSYATVLIGEMGYDEALAFVEYGVARAEGSNYSVNTLSGLKAYNADFRATRVARERARQEDARRAQEQRDEADRAAYAAYRGRRADEYLGAAPASLRTKIEMEAAARVRARGGMFGKITSPLALRLECQALIQDRLNLLSFEDWFKEFRVQ
jgi:hypothetical protein